MLVSSVVMASQTPPSPLEQGIRELVLQHSHPVPGWLEVRTRQAMARFETLGLPSKKHEAWKYIDLKTVTQTPYAVLKGHSADVSPAAIEPYCLPQAHRLVFVNGTYDARSSSVGQLPAQAFVGDLATGLLQYPQLVEQFLARGIETEADPFIALNTATLNTPFLSGSALVYLPAGTVLTDSIQLLFLNQLSEEQNQLNQPRVLVILEEGAQASLCIQTVGLGTTSTFTNLVSEIHLASGAQLEGTLLQLEADSSAQFTSTRAFLNKGSQFQWTTVPLQGQLIRNFTETHFAGEDARVVLNGLSLLTNETQVYQHTEIHHDQPRCVSQQLYKGILWGKTRSEFDGTIFVHRDAQQTEAQQLNKNLILSDDARVFTRPQLRIDADDVKCSHGATVGQLDEEALFYLASRGIGHEEAQRLLTYGFAEDIVSKITLPALREHLESFVLQHLSGS